MTLNQIETNEAEKVSLMNELNLSENDKYSLWKYLQWKNYKTKGKVKTNSISDPQEFFKQINEFSEEQKSELLKELNDYFSNRQRVEENHDKIIQVRKDIENNKSSQSEESENLKNELLKDEWISKKEKKINEWKEKLATLSDWDKNELLNFLLNKNISPLMTAGIFLVWRTQRPDTSELSLDEQIIKQILYLQWDPAVRNDIKSLIAREWLVL